MPSSQPAPGLLVSVRSAAEAAAALAGGASIIDVKEPSRGSLGRADDDTIVAVVRLIAGRAGDQLVSAALGELIDGADPCSIRGLAYVKWGLAGLGSRDWRTALGQAIGTLGSMNPGCGAVAVAYADSERASSPIPEEVCDFAGTSGCGAFLLDTCIKDGTTLLDWMSLPRIQYLRNRCREAGIKIALAGSLNENQIEELTGTAPDWFAVRGAVCREGNREADIDETRVQRLVGRLSSVRSEG